METKARLKDINKNLITGETTFTFSTKSERVAEELERLKDSDIRVRAVKYRKKRSLSANAMFWACCGRIANAVQSDKWTVYLSMLKKYGKYTFVACKPNMVDSIRSQWRECEVWNSININGKPAVQMICYFGSSSYDTAEMSRLIDGTIQEMKDLGLDLPMTQDIKTALENWEVQNEKYNSE